MAYALNIKNLSTLFGWFKSSIKSIFMNNDFFALLGPNGAGKTSLINIITQLNHSDEGD